MSNRKKANQITALIMLAVAGLIALLVAFPVQFMLFLLGIILTLGLYSVTKIIRNEIEDNLDEKDMEAKYSKNIPDFKHTPTPPESSKKK